MSSGSNPHNERYFVDGFGRDWYIVSRNNKTVAKCTSKAGANKITKLLIEAAESDDKRARLLAARIENCEPVEVEGVEHVRYGGYDHYLAHSLLEALTEDEP